MIHEFIPAPDYGFMLSLTLLASPTIIFLTNV